MSNLHRVQQTGLRSNIWLFSDESYTGNGRRPHPFHPPSQTTNDISTAKICVATTDSTSLDSDLMSLSRTQGPHSRHLKRSRATGCTRDMGDLEQTLSKKRSGGCLADINSMFTSEDKTHFASANYSYNTFLICMPPRKKNIAATLLEPCRAF